MEKRRRSIKSFRRVLDTMWETGETWAEGENKHVDKKTITVGVDPEDVENINKAGRKAQGAQGLRKNCRESLSRLIRGFWNKCY